MTHFAVGDTLGELALWVVATPGEEAGFSDELTAHVLLHEGSWAQSSQRTSTMTRLASSSTQTWSRAGDEVPGRQFERVFTGVSCCGADRYRLVASNRSPFARSTSTKAQTPLQNM